MMRKWLYGLMLASLVCASASAQVVVPITETPTAGTITAGGTPQVALPSGYRHGCQILNTSTAVENIDVLSTPVTPIQPNGTYTCNVAEGQVSNQTIYILGATTGQTFEVTSW